MIDYDRIESQLDEWLFEEPYDDWWHHQQDFKAMYELLKELSYPQDSS